ncbi:MAG TPA: TIGR00269 family protein [Thermoplasmata archaeon]|nr:TIGR00269 family protein [Thermoplasmata archaeon]
MSLHRNAPLRELISRASLGGIVHCDRCEAEAAIDRPYAGDHLCGSHLRESVEDRARHAFHRQLPRFHRGTVAVALSGGKDSAVTLQLAHRYFARRPTVRLVALTVDEGIEGYRADTVVKARELTHRLGVEHRVVSAKDQLGTTTDSAARTLAGIAPCSYCGVWRRQLLNRAARDVGADALVLGFNLDDLAQTVLMNVARADIRRMVRMAPHRRRQPDLVPRVAPLAQVPEREVFLYALLTATPFDHGECPHAGRASRNVFRDVLYRLEEAIPGTRQALLRSHEQIVDLLEPGEVGAPARCVDCGEPSTGERCRACEYRESLKSAERVGAVVP